MKILYLSRDSDFLNTMLDDDLVGALSKNVKIRMLSAVSQIGSTLRHKKYNIKKLSKDFDAIIISCFATDYSSWENIEEVSIPKLMIQGDPATIKKEQIQFALKANVDIILCPFHNWTSYLNKITGIPTIWFPNYVDINQINNITHNKRINKNNDVLWSPSKCNFYPIRYDMTETNFLNKEKIKSFPIGRGKGDRKRLTYEDYLFKIMCSKLFVFDGTMYNYSIVKYFEGMGCKTCVVATKPIDSEFLHFVPDENFVEITKHNYKRKIKYYLANNEERKIIAKNGYVAIKKYHTSDIRAKQLLKIIETLIRNKNN